MNSNTPLLATSIWLGTVMMGVSQSLSIVQFTSTTYSVKETGGVAIVVVERVGPPDQWATVHYYTIDYSTKDGEDYTGQNGYLTFLPGETNLTITIPILNDAQIEADEMFGIYLNDPDPFDTELGTNTTLVVTIIDNDSGVGFAFGAFVVSEDGGAVILSVYRVGDPMHAFTVHYATSNQTAEAGMDYIAQNGILSFADGDISKDIVIPILNDAEIEASEEFLVTLTNPSDGVPLGLVSQTRVIIHDNDRGVFFAPIRIGMYSAPLWDTKENAGTVVVAVQRVGEPAGAFTVDYATRDASAIAGQDYVAQTGTLSFAAGETNKTITLSILDDAIVNCPNCVDKSTKGFYLSLTNATGGVSLGDPARVIVGIEDNEYPGPRGFALSSSNDFTGEAIATATVTVIRTGDSIETLSVGYSTSNGTAIAGADYSACAGTLVFGPLETEKRIVISVFDDGLVEDDEEFFLTLSNPSAGTVIARDVTTIRIADNDRPGSLDFSFDAGQVFASRRVSAIAIQSDAKMLVASDRVEECLGGGAVVGNLQRLLPNGSLDTTFNPDFEPKPEFSIRCGFAARNCGERFVSSLAFQADCKVIVVGGFCSVYGPERNALVRLNPDGSLDTSFNPGPITFYRPLGWWWSPKTQIIIQPDGKLLFAAPFERIGRLNRADLVRCNRDGSIDNTFSTEWSGYIDSMALLPNGKLIVAGFANDLHTWTVARFNPDGSRDPSFVAPQIGIDLRDDGCSRRLVVAAQPDGKLLIGGSASSFWIGGERRGFSVARLNADGSLDEQFAVLGMSYCIQDVNVQADDKVLVASGGGTCFNGDSGGLVRLNANGRFDETFRTGAINCFGSEVLALQGNGQAVIGGSFTVVNGFPRLGIVRLVGDRNYIRLDVPRFATNGTVLLSINTQPGSHYVLEASSNLTDWFCLQTNTATSYRLAFEDATAPRFNTRFYRATRLTP